MAIRTVGTNGTHRSIAEAMAASGPGDTIRLQAGYSNERATVLYSGMTIEGEASSTGIVLDLAMGVATVTLAGTAPIDVNDAADGNGIVGNDGDNLITVTSGADSASGGAGEDRLFVDYRLATGAITGTEANVAEAGGGGRLVTIDGGFEHYTIWTGAGADTITTGAGDDSASGGAGDDSFYFGAAFTAADRVNGGAGTDVVQLFGTYNVTLAADSFTSVERLTLFGGATQGGSEQFSYTIATVNGNVEAGKLLTVLGTSLRAAETLVFNGSAEQDGSFHVAGGAANDTIAGGQTHDGLFGGAGNDQLFGLGGDDYLVGGAGADILRGGLGSDRFVFTATSDSMAGSVDRILDFQAGRDRIDLTKIDANTNAGGNQAFSFIGTNAFGGVAGELRVYSEEGHWFVSGDVDGNGTGDFLIQVDTFNNHILVGADFLL